MDDETLDLWIQLTVDVDTRYDGGSTQEVDLPFDVEAEEYLEAAKRHLAERNDKVGLADALGDAKRALDCRLEELLFVFALDGQARKERWPVPKKLDVLAELALPAPKLLKKLNTLRNAVEHEFRALNPDTVADFVDAVTLFLESTWWYIHKFADQADFVNDELDGYWWQIRLDREARQLGISIYVQGEGQVDMATVGVDHPSYMRLLRVFLAAAYGRQGLLKA